METIKLLLIHGNGGASSRFNSLLEIYNQQEEKKFVPYIPQLPGFENRPIEDSTKGWDIFISALQSTVEEAGPENWFLYGHGIGGSMLLEWAARGWGLPSDSEWKPKFVMLHAPVGASLSERWFPKVMKNRSIRALIHWMIYQNWLRSFWEKKLFLEPKNIPLKIRQQFFQDYKECRAFPIFFDLITTSWYKETKAKIKDESFYFIWGKLERVIASQYISLWKRDFPNAIFDVVENWDHFPMLDNPKDFYQKIESILIRG